MTKITSNVHIVVVITDRLAVCPQRQRRERHRLLHAGCADQLGLALSPSQEARLPRTPVLGTVYYLGSALEVDRGPVATAGC
jgi:hypothetical protein